MPDRTPPNRPPSGPTGPSPSRLLSLPALLALLAPLALAGCTGTTETRAPVLLIAASNGASPRLVVIEDTFGTSDLVEDRFVVLGSGTTLDAPVVAMEVADPLGGRDPIVVLTRSSASAEAPHAAELRLFRSEGLDPGPGGEIELEPVDLVPGDDAVALALDPLLTTATGVPVPCPVDMAVARAPDADGPDDLRVALLLDPSACGGTAAPSVVAVDVLEGAVAWSDATSLVRASGIASDPVEATFAYVAGDDVLVVDLEGESASDAPLALDDDPVDLARAGRALLALADDALEVVAPADGGDGAEPVATRTGARRIVEEPFDALESVVVLGGNRVRLHASTDDASPGHVGASGALWGTVDPFGRFAYVPLPGENLGVLDLLGYDDESRSGTSLAGRWEAGFTVPGLAAPGPIAWVPAAGTIAPEPGEEP